MKAHSNAQKPVRWLRQHQPATVAQIAANRVDGFTGRVGLQSSTACVMVFSSVKRAGARASERVQYHLTGHPLRTLKAAPAPSFDGLLQA